MPKVSIIVPVYNVEKYIEKCLTTLVNQTLQEIEIIVVNDGSTDNSKVIINEFINKFPNKIKYLEKENGGLSDARNFGIPYATGEYIAFLDSDDYVELNMYEEMYNKAKEEKCDYVECDFIWEYPNKIKNDIGIEYRGKNEMILNARVVAWNKLIKRSILEKNHFQFTKGVRYEDVDFFYKLVPHLNKVSFVRKPFVHYIQRDTSIANTQNEKTRDIFVVLENTIKYYKENSLFEEYKNELEYTYTRLLLCSSLLRIIKIKDKKVKKDLLEKTWKVLNETFPKWKKNIYLQKNKSLKNLYIKSVNKFTFKVYTTILSLIY